MATKNKPLGLYIHIPFCAKKCHYCDFVITTQSGFEKRENFLKSLEKHLENIQSSNNPLNFETLYLGGGTPSLLEAHEFKRLISKVKDLFLFKESFEFTVEMNPADISRELLDVYQDMGVNRISLGVQAFQDRLLKAMNRDHKVKDILRSTQLLKEYHFENISMDLIIKLPGQTVEDIVESLENIIKLGAKQVAVYDLDIHEKTYFGEQQKKGVLSLPSEDEHEAMFKVIQEFLIESGYEHYELSNFAIPGYASKHNLIYWHNQEYIGVGPGAFSYQNGIRYQFSGSVKKYLEKCEKDDWAPESKDILTEDEIEKENFLTGVRLLKEGIDLSKFKILKQGLEDKANIWIEDGFMIRKGDHLFFLDKGKMIAENILADFAGVMIP